MNPSSLSTIDRVACALEENLWEFWARFGRGGGCALHREEHALWFDTPIPTLPYNGVLRFSADRQVDRRIDALFDHYRRRAVPFLWMVHPSARPANLPDRLRARGLEEAESFPGMWAALRDVPSPNGPGSADVAPSLRVRPRGALAAPEVEIREVRDDADVADVLALVAWRWHVPSGLAERLGSVTRGFELGRRDGAVRCWIAHRGGVAVAKAFLHLAAGAAGVYGVATRPEARGLGLARTLTLLALAAARRAGYELAVLHSTPMARPLYEKVGFRLHAPFRLFAPPNALHG